MHTPPAHIYRQRYRQYWYIPFALMFPLAVGGMVYIGMILEGRPTEEWALSAIGVAAIAVFGWLVGGLIIGTSWLFETRQIQRTINNALVVWPQAIDETHWQGIVHENYERSKGQIKFSWWSIVVVVVILGGVFIYTMMMVVDAEQRRLLVLVFAGLGVIIPGIIANDYWQRKRRLSRTFRFQQQADNPRVFISKHGIYHEALGYEAFDDLRQIEMTAQQPTPPGRWSVFYSLFLPADDMALARGWQLMRFHIRRRISSYNSMPAIINVMVPPDRVEEAQQLVIHLRQTHRLRH